MTRDAALEAVLSLNELSSTLSSRIKAELESRLTGPIAPNELIELYLPRDLNCKQLRILAIFSWTLADEARSLLQLKLSLQERRDPSDMLRVALLSKEGSLAVLASSASERDFYGNIRRTLERLAGVIRVQGTRPPRAVKPNRRRGYRETHKPPQSSASREWLEDWSSTEEQNHIEQKRTSLENLFQTFWGTFSNSA